MIGDGDMTVEVCERSMLFDAAGEYLSMPCEAHRPADLSAVLLPASRCFSRCSEPSSSLVRLTINDGTTAFLHKKRSTPGSDRRHLTFLLSFH